VISVTTSEVRSFLLLGWTPPPRFGYKLCYFSRAIPLGFKFDTDQFAAWINMFGNKPMPTVAAPVITIANCIAGLELTPSVVVAGRMNIAFATRR
jgi:hypothetical protein